MARPSQNAKTAAKNAVITIERIAPPLDLPHEMVERWRDIVQSLPADHFHPESIPLLKAYVRHTVNADRIADMIETALRSKAKSAQKDYLALLVAQTRESKAMCSLATKLRLSISAQHSDHAKTVKHYQPMPAPWAQNARAA